VKTERGWRLILFSGLLILACFAFVLTAALMRRLGTMPGYFVGVAVVCSLEATFVVWMKRRRPIPQT
jgi:hypothetical protein